MFRRRFADLVRRQLELFELDNAELLAGIAAADRAYDGAARDEAEERYADYAELVETATEHAAALRDAYAAALDDAAADEYEATFNAAVGKRFPPLGLEIEDA